MYYGKRQLAGACVAAILGGMVLHRLYGWIPHGGTALFSLVRESVWEHTKILFWPLLGAGLWLSQGRPGAWKPWLLAMEAACALMLVLGWLYNIVLGGEAAWVNFVLYLLLMAGAFWLATQFSGPFQGTKWSVPVVLALGLGLLIALFTLKAPEGRLFADLAAAGLWYELPC